jgi:hypothetical protein
VIALLTTAARAANPFAECDGARPIGGTAGFANARDALRTSIETYSASAVAERRLLPRWAHGAEGVDARFLYESHSTYGVADVPVYYGPASNCPPEAQVGLLPLDVSSVLFGGAARGARGGVFYAASATIGWQSMPATYDRLFVNGLGIPLYASMVAVGAPAAGGFVTQSGVSALALDWIAGANLDLFVADVRAGYAGSQGFYGSVSEHHLGLFGSSILRARPDPLDALKAGLDRFTVADVVPGDATEKVTGIVGLTTLYLRDLPWLPPVGGDPAGTARLRSGHFAQENVGGIVDLGAAYTFAPVRSVQTWSIGVHTRDFVSRRTDPAPDETRLQARLAGGTVTLPPRWSLGVPGGTRPYFRAEAGVRAKVTRSSREGHVNAALGVHMNDPDQLALYPAARNAVSVDLRVAAVAR